MSEPLMKGLQLSGSSNMINTMALPKIGPMAFGTTASKGLLGNLGGLAKSGGLNAPVAALSGIAGNLISDGYSSDAGALMQGIGSAMSMIPGPVGMIGSAAGAVLGGLTNRAFGSKMNQENINALNSTIDTVNSFQSNANTYDSFMENAAGLKLGSNFDNSFVGKDGWFGNKAKKKARALRAKLNQANQYAMNNIENNLDNLQTEQIGNLMANYSAFGGPLGFDYMPIGGAIDYELANKKLALDELKATNKNSSIMAKGGPLFSNGSTWDNGLSFINNGGSHNENALGGVPMGVDQEGTPNLVEEGEVKWNDYIFSNQLEVPVEILKQYKLPKLKEPTFANVVKKVQKDAEERPNDPIAKRGLDDILSKLANAQEEERARIQMAEQAEQQDIMFALGGGIHIKPSKKGTFTAAASRHHMGVQEFADKVLANKEKYSPAMVKKANFAKNASHWHGDGGNLFADVGQLRGVPPKYSAGALVDAIYQNNPREEFLGEPAHHYDFTQSEEWANSHGYYPDARGHRDDRVKKPAHPTHPSRGSFDGLYIYNLTDKGMEDPNYTMFGMVDGEQDPQATLVYNNSIVLPEVTVAPKGNYIFNPYDNIRLYFDHKKTYGGSLNNPENYSPAMVKKANFARNAAKWHAEGGFLGNYFAGTGDRPNTINPYAYDPINGFKYWNTETNSYDPGYLNFVNNQLNDDWINRMMSGAYGDMSRYKGVNNFNPTVAQSVKLATDKKYSDWHKAVAKAYEESLMGINPKTGQQEPLPGPLTLAPEQGPQTYWGPGAGGKTIWEAASEVGPYGMNTLFGYKGNGWKNVNTAPTPVYVAKDGQQDVVTDNGNNKGKDKTGKDYSNWGSWLRYAPAVGAGIGVFSDLMGWTNKPDFSDVDAIMEASRGIKDVRFTPIGDYMRYNPLDREFYINQLNAESGATRRNLLNTSAGNRGTAMSGILAADYNAQSQLGNLARQAEEYNLEQRHKVADFNRATNMFNAEQDLRAQMANNSNQSMRLNAAVKAAALRDEIRERASQARSLNLTNLFDSLGNIGIDIANRKDRDRLIEAGIFGTLSQRPQGWSKKKWTSYQDDIKKLNNKYKKD